jgi:hypothetical protein
MIALHRLCIVWAVIALGLAAYQFIFVGFNGLMLLGLGVALCAVGDAETTLPKRLTMMWFAFWAVALMANSGPIDIESAAVLIVITPALAYVGWWVLSGLFTRK